MQLSCPNPFYKPCGCNTAPRNSTSGRIMTAALRECVDIPCYQRSQVIRQHKPRKSSAEQATSKKIFEEASVKKNFFLNDSVLSGAADLSAQPTAGRPKAGRPEAARGAGDRGWQSDGRIDVGGADCGEIGAASTEPVDKSPELKFSTLSPSHSHSRLGSPSPRFAVTNRDAAVPLLLGISLRAN